jgi:hypothetical protein
VSEVDPDPNGAGRSTLGGREEPAAGDPTEGGKRGQIGEVPSITSDEPSDGTSYAPGGGRGADQGGWAAPEEAVPPVADPGPDA